MVDPVVSVPGPDGVLPVVDPSDPAIPLPDGSGLAAPDPSDPTPADPTPDAAVPDPSVPEPQAEATAAPGESSGPLPGTSTAQGDKPVTAQRPARALTPALPPLYVPPAGSYPALLAENTVAIGVPGPGATTPAGIPAAPGNVGAPGGSDGTGPLHGNPGPPAPDALPAAPGSGPGSGQSTNGPTGTAAWLPSLYFYLPTMGAELIGGPLQHAYSAVSADPGSSPD